MSSFLSGCAKTDFPHQLKDLNRDLFTIYAMDPRGYGDSIPPERTWENFFERDAMDAAALMQVQTKSKSVNEIEE